MNFPQFWVQEVGQTGTMARHDTQNVQKCCDSHSPVKSTVHKENHFPCSTIITQIARRRISVPRGTGRSRGGATPPSDMQLPWQWMRAESPREDDGGPRPPGRGLGIGIGCASTGGHPGYRGSVQENIRKGAVGAVWNPKFCVPKTGQINIYVGKFHFFPLLNLGPRGGGAPLPAPMVYGHSNTSLATWDGGKYHCIVAATGRCSIANTHQRVTEAENEVNGQGMRSRDRKKPKETCLIWIFSREANHLLPSPQVNSYTPSSQATSAVVRGP